MSRTAILYYSVHHGNTKKLVESIKTKCDVDLYAVSDAGRLDLSGYDTIGLASGVYMNKLHKSLMDYADKHKVELANKKVFLIATYGGSAKKAFREFTEYLTANGIGLAGQFSCPGYDTCGIFKLVGGTRKNHPNDKDCQDAVQFMKTII